MASENVFALISRKNERQQIRLQALRTMGYEGGEWMRPNSGAKNLRTIFAKSGWPIHESRAYRIP
jgi:hypothetical protein